MSCHHVHAQALTMHGADTQVSAFVERVVLLPTSWRQRRPQQMQCATSSAVGGDAFAKLEASLATFIQARHAAGDRDGDDIRRYHLHVTIIVVRMLG
jgi:hypothetical protein